MKKVNIQIISTQTDGNQTNRDVNNYVGTFEKTDDGFVLTYNESEDFGAKAQTSVRLESKTRAIIERTGSVNSVIIIEKGVSHTNVYPTQYGEILLKFYAKDVKSTLTTTNGELFLKYEILADKNSISTNTITLSFKEMQN